MKDVLRAIRALHDDIRSIETKVDANTEALNTNTLNTNTVAIHSTTVAIHSTTAAIHSATEAIHSTTVALDETIEIQREYGFAIENLSRQIAGLADQITIFRRELRHNSKQLEDRAQDRVRDQVVYASIFLEDTSS